MAHGGGGRAKVTPNLAMDEEGTRMLNLTVLQRLDPAVEDILITAAHVTLYDFDTDLNQWSRKDVEGSLFVVKRFVPVPNAVDLMPLLRLDCADFVFGLSPTQSDVRHLSRKMNSVTW